MTAAETLFEAFVDRARRVHGLQVLEEPAAVAILEADPGIRAAVVVMALQRQCPTWRTLGDVLRTAAGVPRDHWLEYGLGSLLARLLRAALPFSADQIVPMLHALSRSDPAQLAFAGPLRAVERFVAEHGVSPEMRPMLERVRQTIEKHDTYGGLRNPGEPVRSAEWSTPVGVRKLQTRVTLMLASGEAQSAPVDDRFAGHIIRQHPFLNLCQQRGWQYTIQGHWDSHNLPTRDFPRWGIRARLGVDPIDHARDDYIFNYLVTGQVTFHAVDDATWWDAALPLEQVPPLLFSEVLRDLDLFVGVSTVANDPSWSEAGVKTSWSRYWTDAVRGELAPVAATRREVLTRVLPRTTLRDRATLQDRWLVVGEHRIHLGTANVWRAEDSTPQVVLPDRRAKDHVARVFLPFEGDSMLATILAKAFVLAQA